MNESLLHKNLVSAAYNKMLVRYLSNNNLNILHSNMINRRDLFENFIIEPEDHEITDVIKEILKKAVGDALDFSANLSNEKIAFSVNAIINELIIDYKNGEWPYLKKEDIQYDLNRDKDLSSYFNNDLIKDYPEYVSNAWNNVICIRALIKWMLSPAFKGECKDTILEIIVSAYDGLKAFVASGINKYPLDATNKIVNVHDTAFVLKMLYRINKYFLNANTPAEKIIDLKPRLSTLVNNQNRDGGWSTVLIKDGKNIAAYDQSNIGATCYVLLLFADLRSESYLDDLHLEDSIKRAQEFLLMEVGKQDDLDSISGQLAIETNCLSLQTLCKFNIEAFEYRVRILNSLLKMVNMTLPSFVSNDLDNIALKFDVPEEQIIRKLSLIVTTLLKAGISVKSPVITIPLSWLISKGKFESKSNLVHIVCCIADYLEAEKDYLLYGDKGVKKEKEFVL